MALSVLILGSGSALPTLSANQTAQIVTSGNQNFLVDCGEGTQVLLRKNKVKMQQIHHVFISHLHGDHFFGLVGLLSTMHLLGRKKELTLFGPKGLEEVVTIQFKHAGSRLLFPINFHVVDQPGQLLYENQAVKITSLPLKHRIPCFGFLFQEKEGLRKLNGEQLKAFNVPNYARKGIAEGKDFVMESGELVPNHSLTSDPPAPKSYAFCSDTAYHNDLISFIAGVDLLYHEATFLEQDAERASKTYHSTAKQAAAIAQKAGVQQLILGHFSNRYKNRQLFVEEAAEIFENTHIAEEGKSFSL